MAEHVSRQRGDARLVADRRQLSGRTPHETHALQGVQGLLHRSRRRRRCETVGDGGLQFFVRQRRRGLKPLRHLLGHRQPAGPIQLDVPVFVVVRDAGGHVGPHRFGVGRRQPDRSGCQTPLPQGAAPDLNEVRVALAVGDHRIERVAVDVHAVGRQRFDQGGPGGRGAQPADAQAPVVQPVPERSVHRAEMRRQPRRAGQYEQERGVGPDVLGGVQQQLADIMIEGMRFVEQDGQRPAAAAGGQALGQFPQGRGRCRPFRPADAREAEPPRQELPDAGGRQQPVDQILPGPYLARRQARDVHAAGSAAGALEPVEQHRLAVAAWPRQRDVVRGGSAAGQVRQALPQHRLLPLSPRERRRGGAGAGLEQPRLRLLRAGEFGVGLHSFTLGGWNNRCGRRRRVRRRLQRRHGRHLNTRVRAPPGPPRTVSTRLRPAGPRMLRP